MVSVRLFYPSLFLFLVLMGVPRVVMCGASLRGCEFPAIYNFGDSNSDTGGKSASMTEVLPPNGETFFGRPSGRYCDGRLIIDFVGKALYLFVVTEKLISGQLRHLLYNYLCYSICWCSREIEVAIPECILGLDWCKFQTWCKFCNCWFIYLSWWL